MSRQSITSIVLSFLCLAVVWGKPIPAPKPPDFGKLKEESIKKWSGVEILATGKIASVKAGPVGLSEPPLYTFTLELAPEKVLRGSAKLEKSIAVSYSIRQKKPPIFPTPDKEVVIAMKRVGKVWIMQSLEETTAATVEQATLATSFPLGWTIKEGKLVSPWVGVAKPGKAEGIACSVTGRPVLLAGDSASLSVEPMPPAVKMKFGNPDGDGEFKLTVKNESNDEIEIPALLTDGKIIQWNESIVIRSQDKTYPIPGATGKTAGLKSVTLKAGESVSGTTHVFALDGPTWPKGGYRIEFQFCLGEKSATHSFYYLSKHHDPIREAVQKGLKK